MDIHKPKAWHGFREFLKEYVIIVVGVLTALSAEAGVEWLHWRHEVDVARATLKADYIRLITWSGERDAEAPCIVSRISEVADHLETAEATGRLPPLGGIFAPTRRPWTVRGWDGVVSSQVLTHFPEQEAALISANALYAQSMQQMRDKEMDHWAVLVTLEGPGRPLNPGEGSNLRAVLGMTATETDLMRRSARTLSAQITRTGSILTHEEAANAWNDGAVIGQKAHICQPLGAVPRGLSEALSDPFPDASGKGPKRMPF